MICQSCSIVAKR